MPRVLVTGAGGLLGGRIAELLHGRGFEVVGLFRTAAPPAGPVPFRAELRDAESVARALGETRPAAVVHAAVMSRPDQCEARPEDAASVNARLPGLVAAACAERGLRLVAISTDLVFGGERSWSREHDPTGPCNEYGRSKLDGERAVLAACPAAAVARVALVLGRGHGPRTTSSEGIVQALQAGRRPRLYTDEYRTPVDPESVAAALDRLLRGDLAGVVHLGGPERISRYELGVRVARAFELPEDRLVRSLQAEHPTSDRRAPDTSLDSGRARRELGFDPRPIDEAIREGRV